METYKIAENMYGYPCPGTLTHVHVTNYNPGRNPCYTILMRAGCLIASELWQLPEQSKATLPGAMVPVTIGINLHSQTDIAAVQWRGVETRGRRAFPLQTPSCSARPGRACIQGATPGGTLWSVTVCSDLAEHEAKARKIPYREELARYAIHGLLHLAGEGDRDHSSAAHMFRRQEAFLRSSLRRTPLRAGRMDLEMHR